jgi:hypothetical protein
VFRARRALATSVVDSYFRQHLAGEFTIEVDAVNNVTCVTRELPEEEAFEALAGRIRPVLLDRDPTFYGTALNALNALSGRDADIVERTRDCVTRGSRLAGPA